MRLISLELPDEPWDISEVEVEFLRLKDACEQEMKNHIACFAGLLYAISGDYPDSLRSHVHQGEPGDWLNRIALFHAMSISQSAMYLAATPSPSGQWNPPATPPSLPGKNLLPALADHLCFLLLRKAIGTTRLTIWTSSSPAPIRWRIPKSSPARYAGWRFTTTSTGGPAPPTASSAAKPKRHRRGFAPLPFCRSLYSGYAV